MKGSLCKGRGNHPYGKASLLILSLLIAVSLAGVWLMPSSAENSVIEISTLEQLKELRTNVNNGASADAKVKLTADIDLGGSAANQWTPIGSDDTMPFSGVFDGQGHKITGLYISTDKDYQGLFGYVSGDSAEIKGLTVSGAVRGFYEVGGLVGYNYGGEIADCTSSVIVNVNGSGEDAGGIVGWNKYGKVINCTATGAVRGYDFTGGVVGDNENGKITNCTSSGNVSGNECIGGVVGSNYGDVTKCVSSCNVSGYSDVGGVAGWNNDGTITNCTSSGNVSGHEDIGGVAGWNVDGTVTNCTSSGNVSGYSDVGGVAGGSGGVTVTNCVSSCNVSGFSDVGGVVGYNGDGTVTNCGWLWSGHNGYGVSGDLTSVDHVVSFDEEDMDKIAVTFTVDPRSLTVTKGGTGTVGIPKPPHTTGLTLDLDKSIATASAADGIITVTGVGEGTARMTVDATFHPTLFSGDLTETSGDYQVSEDVTIMVSGYVPPTSPDNHGGSSSGCNAGFGALALLCAPLFIKRRKG